MAEVYDFLKSKGFTVDTQVGCSGFKIDLALKTSDNLYPFCNTVILEALYRLKEKTISDKDFNDILNMIDTYVYSIDLLGLFNVYDKINNEIVVEKLKSQPFIGVLHDTS